MLRDYAPITNILAMLLLPLALWYTQSLDPTIASTYRSWWLREAFLVSYFAQKINDHTVWGHLGPYSITGFRALDIWSSPCKSRSSVPSLNLLRPFTRRA